MAAIPVGETKVVTKKSQPILSGLYGDNIVAVNITISRDDGDIDGIYYSSLFSDIPSDRLSRSRKMRKMIVSSDASMVSIRRYKDELLIKKDSGYNNSVKVRAWCLA